MKKIFCLSFLLIFIGCYTPLKTEKEKIKIVDAWIKKFEPGKKDSLVVRTQFVLHKVVSIPYSEEIKFDVRGAEEHIIFLESKASNKKISFNAQNYQWGLLKTLQ